MSFAAKLYEHPAANRFRKHWKSSTFSTGLVVDPSQFADASPLANRFRKHWKSSTLRIGGVVDASQLAAHAGPGTYTANARISPLCVPHPAIARPSRLTPVALTSTHPVRFTPSAGSRTFRSSGPRDAVHTKACVFCPA